MKDNYEDGLTQLAATLRQNGMSGPAGFALRARDALGRRERALRNIKGAFTRWYDNRADADTTLRDIECYAVSVWIQEEVYGEKQDTANVTEQARAGSASPGSAGSSSNGGGQ